jgi:adapter protein MecA 1/2
MKMERLGQDKIRIFLTFDDLSERGIPKDDMLKETYKLRELFIEMMDQAYSELGFDPSGPLAVEVYSMPAQGMVVIVTSTSMEFYHSHEDALEDSESDEVYSMEVVLEQSDIITYVFQDFEDVIRVSKLIQEIVIDDGALYKYKDRWVLQFEQMDLENEQYQTLIAILSEYGEVSSITQAVLQEYGHTIMESDSVKQLCHYF